MANAKKPTSGKKPAAPKKASAVSTADSNSSVKAKPASAGSKSAPTKPVGADKAKPPARSKASAAATKVVKDIKGDDAPVSQAANAAVEKAAEPAKREQAKSDASTLSDKVTEKTVSGTASDKVEKAPEPTTPTTPSHSSNVRAAEAPVRTQNKFIPLFFGGAVAAVLGFVASEANFLGFRSQDNSLRAAVSTLEDQVDGLKAPDLSEVEKTLSMLGDQIAVLGERVDELDARPATVTIQKEDGTPVEDVRAELSAMQAALEAQRTEIESLLGNAKSVEEATAAAARVAAGQRALAQVTSSISNGGGYADAIAAMQAAGITDLPAALTDPAEKGVVTLINLQSRFPDIARTALTDVRAVTTDGDGGGLSGFLRRQLGARSVAPREGNDPDAVLSRAEAALRDGRLMDALAETDVLPDGAKDAMQSWLADARVRADAQVAVDALSNRLTAN